MSRKLLFLLIIMVLSLIAVGPVQAGEIQAKFANDLNSMSSDDFITGLIHLKEKVDLPALRKSLLVPERLPARIRHEKVIRTLQELAERTQKPLIEALKDDAWSIREQAAECLGMIKDLRAVQPLIEALKDDHSLVRRKAAWALGSIGGPLAVAALIAALKDPDPFVRERVVLALGSIGDPEAVGALVVASRDPSPGARAAAKWALTVIKGK